MIRSPRNRLAAGLLALLSCGSQPPTAGGLLAGNTGISLAGPLLVIASTDGNELKALDIDAGYFVRAPNVVLPLSIPTVVRPGFVCGDVTQSYTASQVLPSLGVVNIINDATDDELTGGMRELGQVNLPGLASAMVCAKDPVAVTAHKIAVAGSVAAYDALADAGAFADFPDGSLPDGGFDERHTLASLQTVALIAINNAPGPESPTLIYQVSNDPTGANCPGVSPCVTDGGAVCPVFCPSAKPLMSLPPQPPSCQPVGPPQATGIDVAGSGVGLTNLGSPDIDPFSVNVMMASDRNSNCVAQINLDDLSVHWIDATAATSGVFAFPYYPGSCAPGGLLFAAALDVDACTRNDNPPPGGYNNCNGLVFYYPSTGQRVPEPLPYPFQSRGPEHPVRVPGIVGSLAYAGYGMQVGYFSATLAAPVPIQFLAIPGTAVGDLVYVDLGPGPAIDGGFPAFPVCPPQYYAPRLLDQNDYVTNPISPSLITIQAVDPFGNLLGTPPQEPCSSSAIPGGPDCLLLKTASGGQVPLLDRLNNSYPIITNPDGTTAQGVDCYAYAPNSVAICLTDGLIQHGVAETEAVTVTYQGVINNLSGVSGVWTGSQVLVQPGYYGCANDGGAGGGPACDLTTTLDGLLVREMANLTVELNAPGQLPCGDYAVSSVGPTSLVLTQPAPAAPASCPPGLVNFTIFASGDKPYTVSGLFTGFQTNLWAADGRLQLLKYPRWQYPANLAAMERSAQQLADITFGLPTTPPVIPDGTSVPVPVPVDYDALDSPFGLALIGALGTVADGGLYDDAGLSLFDGGLNLFDGGTIIVTPERGASYKFITNSGVLQVVVNPLDVSANIVSMTSFTDIYSTQHVLASYQGGSALVELNPVLAYYLYLFETH
jgi:hypothetical protein